MSNSLDYLVNLINSHRNKGSLKNIVINVRPSVSVPNKNTIEVAVKGHPTPLFKSINGGSINVYLKGMLQAYQDAPVTISVSNQDFNSYVRRVEL